MKSESHADLDVGVQAGFQNAVVLPVPLVEEVQDFCGVYCFSSPNSKPKATFAVCQLL